MTKQEILAASGFDNEEDFYAAYPTPEDYFNSIGQTFSEDNSFAKGGWIQKATASIKRRGTEGVCTGSKFGGPSCRPGTRRYALAKTFRKMAKARKKEDGGMVDMYEDGGEMDAYQLMGMPTPEMYYMGGPTDYEPSYGSGVRSMDTEFNRGYAQGGFIGGPRPMFGRALVNARGGELPTYNPPPVYIPGRALVNENGGELDITDYGPFAYAYGGLLPMYKKGGFLRKVGRGIRKGIKNIGKEAGKVVKNVGTEIGKVANADTLRDIGAAAYGLGEGLLDTVTFGATDALTDKGYYGLQKLGGASASERRQQDSLRGYGNIGGAVGGAILNPGALGSAISEGAEGLGAGVSKGSPKSKFAQTVGQYAPVLGNLAGTAFGQFGSVGPAGLEKANLFAQSDFGKFANAAGQIGGFYNKAQPFLNLIPGFSQLGMPQGQYPQMPQGYPAMPDFEKMFSNYMSQQTPSQNTNVNTTNLEMPKSIQQGAVDRATQLAQNYATYRGGNNLSGTVRPYEFGLNPTVTAGRGKGYAFGGLINRATKSFTDISKDNSSSTSPIIPKPRFTGSRNNTPFTQMLNFLGGRKAQYFTPGQTDITFQDILGATRNRPYWKRKMAMGGAINYPEGLQMQTYAEGGEADVPEFKNLKEKYNSYLTAQPVTKYFSKAMPPHPKDGSMDPRGTVVGGMSEDGGPVEINVESQEANWKMNNGGNFITMNNNKGKLSTANALKHYKNNDKFALAALFNNTERRKAKLDARSRMMNSMMNSFNPIAMPMQDTSMMGRNGGMLRKFGDGSDPFDAGNVTPENAQPEIYSTPYGFGDEYVPSYEGSYNPNPALQEGAGSSGGGGGGGGNFWNTAGNVLGKAGDIIGGALPFAPLAWNWYMFNQMKKQKKLKDIMDPRFLPENLEGITAKIDTTIDPNLGVVDISMPRAVLETKAAERALRRGISDLQAKGLYDIRQAALSGAGNLAARTSLTNAAMRNLGEKLMPFYETMANRQAELDQDRAKTLLSARLSQGDTAMKRRALQLEAQGKAADLNALAAQFGMSKAQMAFEMAKAQAQSDFLPYAYMSEAMKGLGQYGQQRQMAKGMGVDFNDILDFAKLLGVGKKG